MKLLFLLVLIAVDVLIAIAAFSLLIQYSGIIAIVAIILKAIGFPTGWIAIIAIAFSAWKGLHIWRSNKKKD